MYVGTAVLVAAIACLVEVGPTEQDRTADETIALLKKTQSLAWTGCMLDFIFLAFTYLKSTTDASNDSYGLIIALSTIQAGGGVIGASIGKVMLTQDGLLLYVFVGLYIASGLLNFGAAAMAAAKVDLALQVRREQAGSERARRVCVVPLFTHICARWRRRCRCRLCCSYQ